MTDRRARYYMIGGFLGAGKSTAILRFARRLADRGERVGLITNDQGSGLVDTAFLRSHGFPVEEIPGGCFCCRFHSLREASERLTEEARPHAFLAEPVGSCTDLMATVTYPLRRMYGDRFSIAPLSVVVDPVRALRVLGLAGGASFSSKVVYVYRKQLEEAGVLVINKRDAVEPADLARLRDALAAEYPHARIFTVSARERLGLDDWFAHLEQSEVIPGAAMEVDYRLYGEGEALLGWLNASMELRSARPLDAVEVLSALADAVRAPLAAAGIEIAHLKLTLAPSDGSGEVAVVNLVRNDFVPEAGQALLDPVTSGHVVLNLRAEGDPALLERAVREAAPRVATARGAELRIEDLESFRPGQPTPAYRESGIPT